MFLYFEGKVAMPNLKCINCSTFFYEDWEINVSNDLKIVCLDKFDFDQENSAHQLAIYISTFFNDKKGALLIGVKKILNKKKTIVAEGLQLTKKQK
jgi:hypothetical protein